MGEKFVKYLLLSVDVGVYGLIWTNNTGAAMRLLTSTDVQNVLKIKRSKLYQMIRCGEFPKAHGSAKTKRWLDIEVDCFLAFFCGQIADNEIFSSISEERIAEIRMCAERARKLA